MHSFVVNKWLQKASPPVQCPCLRQRVNIANIRHNNVDGLMVDAKETIVTLETVQDEGPHPLYTVPIIIGIPCTLSQ